MVQATNPLEGSGDQFNEIINVIKEELPPGMDFEGYCTISINNVSQSGSMFSIYRDTRTTIGKHVVKHIKWTLQSVVKGESYIIVEGRRGYTINCMGHLDQFNKYQEIFNQVIQSFRVE